MDETNRNDRIYELLTDFLNNAVPEPEFSEPFFKDEVETLFNSSIWGHRELVLTILLTKLVYPDFEPTKELYKYHPRPVYEKPIRTAFRERGIPHKKSGPLNVAKNINQLNMDWARGKTDEKVAISAVKIAEKVEQVSLEKLKQFTAAYVSRYKQEATRVKDLEIKLSPQENPLYLNQLCSDLINNVPDGGATAQFITGLLMEIQNTTRKSGVVVSGYLDSVSTTNTTSKKPGDVIELIEETGSEIVYEITTKAFSEDRLLESYEAVTDYDEDISDVFVICRPADVPDSLEITPTALLMASTQYRELSYYFINIYQYVQSMLLFIPKEARENFYQKLIDYVNDTNRSEKVKVYFRQWHKANS